MNATAQIVAIPVPANFRRFNVKFNIQMPDGKLSSGEAEVHALTYTLAFIKILALLGDQDGARVVALQFEDKTDKPIILKPA